MKRPALLIAIPVVLAIAWWATSAKRSGEHTATVAITADQPTELRGSVIATITSLGGIRVEENTTYDGRGASELHFDLPTAKLDDALTALRELGGSITSQQVDNTSAAADAQRLEDQLTMLDSCLDKAAGGSATPAQCRNVVTAMRDRVSAADVQQTVTRLSVKIEPAGASSWALTLVLVGLMVVLCGIGLWAWRSHRQQKALDLRDLGEFELDEQDLLYLRQN